MSWSDIGLGGGGAGGTSTPSRSGSTAIARGRIQIDIDSSQARVQAAARSMGQALKTNLGQGTREGVQQAKKEVEGLDSTLKGLATRLGTLFAVGQINQAAQRMAQLNVRFKAFVGEGAAANAQMEQLREYADSINAPFLDILETAVGIAPSIRGSNVELQKMVDISSRLQIFDPAQGAQGASIALREFISGDYLSLSRRFEMDRKALQNIIQESNGDINKQMEMLDALLDKMGVSTAAMKEMNELRAFERMRDEGQQLIGQVFSPMLTDFVLPIVDGLSDLLRATREWNSELANTALILAGIAATGKGLGSGKAGMVGAVAFGGLQAGVAGSRLLAEQGVVNNPELENISQDQATSQLGERLKQILLIFINTIFEAAKTITTFVGIGAVAQQTMKNGWERASLTIQASAKGVELGFLVAKDAAYDLRDGFLEVVSDLRKGLGEFLVSLAQKDAVRVLGLGDELGEAGMALIPQAGEADMQRRTDAANRDAAISDATNELASILADLQGRSLLPDENQAAAIAATIEQKLADIENLRLSSIEDLNEMLFDAGEEFKEDVQAAAAAVTDERKVDAEILEAWGEFQDDLTAIDEKAQQEREEAERSHQEALTETMTSFQQQREREAEDEARRRAKAEADLAKGIADVQNNANAEIADLEASFQKEEIDRLEDFNRQKEKAERDHNRALEDAAASLDAKRVFDLQRSYEDQRSETQDAFDEETLERQAAKDARIQEIRDETAERITSMQTQFQAEETERAADRAIRMQREDEDFAARLQKMNEQHQQRLVDIQTQANQERQTREQKFIEQNNALTAQLGNHNNTMIAIQRAGLAQMEIDYLAWLQGMQAASGQLAAMQSAQNAASGITSSLANIQPFAVGGTMLTSGLVRAERDETIIPADVSRFLRRQLGGASLNAVNLAAMASGSSGGNKSYGDININIPIENAGQYTPEQLGMIFEGKLIEVLESL